MRKRNESFGPQWRLVSRTMEKKPEGITPYPISKVYRLQVEGGYLYLTWLRTARPSIPSHIQIVFVPEKAL